MRVWAQCVAAVTFLTRLPVSSWAPGPWPDMKDCVWAYPVAGLIVGGAGAAVLWLAQRAGLTPLVASTLAVAAMVLVSGGLHEDGLADTADGFGGGATGGRKLDIMRDSRIGSYGALALALSTALRITALAAMPRGQGGGALLAAGALSRGAMILPLLVLHPARSDGAVAGLHKLRRSTGLCGLALAATGSLWLPLPHALLCSGAVAAAALFVAHIAKRQIGGYTGDVLGCTAVTCECMALLASGLPL